MTTTSPPSTLYNTNNSNNNSNNNNNNNSSNSSTTSSYHHQYHSPYHHHHHHHSSGNSRDDSFKSLFSSPNNSIRTNHRFSHFNNNNNNSSNNSNNSVRNVTTKTINSNAPPQQQQQSQQSQQSNKKNVTSCSTSNNNSNTNNNNNNNYVNSRKNVSSQSSSSSSPLSSTTMSTTTKATVATTTPAAAATISPYLMIGKGSPTLISHLRSKKQYVHNVNTINKHMNLYQFLKYTTPKLHCSQLASSTSSSSSSSSLQPNDNDENANLSSSIPSGCVNNNSNTTKMEMNYQLRDLWNFYDEPYGIDIPVMLDGRREHVYFVPHLSAIQLYRRRRRRRRSKMVGRRRGTTPNFDQKAKNGHLTNNFVREGSTEHDNCSDNLDDGEQQSCLDDQENYGESEANYDEDDGGDDGELLLFEYFETSSPDLRYPLIDKIEELAQRQSLLLDGSVVQLDSTRSWYSIAWYPILCHSQTIPWLKGQMITYHHFVPTMVSHTNWNSSHNVNSSQRNDMEDYRPFISLNNNGNNGPFNLIDPVYCDPEFQQEFLASLSRRSERKDNGDMMNNGGVGVGGDYDSGDETTISSPISSISSLSSISSSSPISVPNNEVFDGTDTDMCDHMYVAPVIGFLPYKVKNETWFATTKDHKHAGNSGNFGSTGQQQQQPLIQQKECFDFYAPLHLVRACKRLLVNAAVRHPDFEHCVQNCSELALI